MQHYPTLRDLVRVIPVAQSVKCGDTTITLLSVDCYADGWIANLRVYHDDVRYYPVFSFSPKYDTNRDRQFGGCGSFFSWHHRDGDPNWYLSYILFPALNPSEPDLEFLVHSVHWSDRTPPDWGILMAEVHGLWRFTLNPSMGQLAEITNATDEMGPSLYLEQREKRRQQTVPLYGHIYDDLLDILYRYDPMGIAWSNPSRAEEYNPEVRTILPRLGQAKSIDDVRHIVSEEFTRWFGDSFSCTERLDQLAEEIWQAWLQCTNRIQ